MSRSTRDSAATRGLLARVESRSTGKLVVGAGAVQVAVHLLHGDLVAATAADDDRQLVRMLSLRGVIEDDRADALEAEIDAGKDVFGEILELGLGDELDVILRERFRQNLCDFVSSVSKPTFHEQKGVFVANIQMGHDTREILDEVCADADLAKTLDLDKVVVRGAMDPGDEPERSAVAELVGDEPRTIGSILHELAAEPTRAKVLLAQLLEDGVVASPAPVDPGGEQGDLAELPYEDDDTVSTDRAALQALRAELAEELEELEPDDDTATPAPAERASGAGGAPRSYADWLERTDGVDHDELEFFEDHDHDRGSDQAGRFSTEDHNLDKVQVTGMDEDERPTKADDDDDDEVLEADEAPSVKFGAPVLSEDEALTKIHVANEVLSVVVQAFDDAEGAGRGRAVLQLLVDGVPSQFTALLHDLTVTEDGELPDGPLLRNLASRPTTEHRQLLNGSLVDIIERALSSAADELPEEALDEVLGSVAGYRQRLGL